MVIGFLKSAKINENTKKNYLSHASMTKKETLEAKIEEKKRKERQETMIDYMKLKIQEEDWHAVADAAMDLQAWENYYFGVDEISR